MTCTQADEMEGVVLGSSRSAGKQDGEGDDGSTAQADVRTQAVVVGWMGSACSADRERHLRHLRA